MILLRGEQGTATRSCAAVIVCASGLSSNHGGVCIFRGDDT
jgi:hypothetical protein